jgi:hypothetical protein
MGYAVREVITSPVRSFTAGVGSLRHRLKFVSSCLACWVRIPL